VGVNAVYKAHASVKTIGWYAYAYYQRVPREDALSVQPRSCSSLPVFAILFVSDLDLMLYVDLCASFTLDLCHTDYTFWSTDRCGIREERKTIYDIDAVTVVRRDTTDLDV